MTENAAFLRKESKKQSDNADEVTGIKVQVALLTSANALRKAAIKKKRS